MRLSAISVVLVVCLAPIQHARAGPCCVSASAAGVDRLLLWEHSAVGLRTTVTTRIGEWRPDGTWRADGGDYDVVEWHTELWGHLRLAGQLSAVLRLPAMLTHIHANELDTDGGGVADMSLGLRYEPLLPGQYAGVPGLAFFLGGVFPTGTATFDASDPADITTRGGWALTTGVSVESAASPWFIRGDVAITIPFAHEAEAGITRRYGVGVATALAAGWDIGANVVASLLASVAWEDELRRDGVAAAGSDRLQPTVGAALSWRFRDHWTLQLSVSTGVFADGAGVNQVGQVATTLGVRYGFFD